MPAMETFILLTTEQLAELNDVAIARGYSRRLSSKFMSTIDPDGRHVIGFNFIHDDACVRALLLVKVDERIDAVHATLDIEISTYMSLPRYGYDVNGALVKMRGDDTQEVTFDEAEALGFDGTGRTSKTPV